MKHFWIILACSALLAAACEQQQELGDNQDAGAQGGSGGEGGTLTGGQAGKSATGGAAGNSGGTSGAGGGPAGTGGANGGSAGTAGSSSGGSAGAITGGSAGSAGSSTGGNAGSAGSSTGGNAGSAGSSTGGNAGSAGGGTGGTGGGTGCDVCPSCKVLASETDANAWTYGIAVDADNVYYGANVGYSGMVPYSITKVTKSTGLPTKLVAGVADSPGVLGGLFHITLADSNVVFGVMGETGSVQKVSVSGGPSQWLATGTTAHPVGAYWLAADATRVWWGDLMFLNSVLLTGGTIDTISMLPIQPGDAIAVNNIHVFIYASDGSGGGGRIMRFDKAQQTYDTFVSNQDGVYSMALSATHLYWALQDAAMVRRIPLSGGNFETLATGTTVIGSIAIDATHVYWVDNAGIQKVPLSGGTVSNVVGGTPCAATLAVDDTSIHFTTGEFAKVVSVPK